MPTGAKTGARPASMSPTSPPSSTIDLADWLCDIAVPSSDSLAPADILAAPHRHTVLFDELLHFYLVLKPPADIAPDRLLEIALLSLDVQISGSLSTSLEVPTSPGGRTIAPPRSQLSIDTFGDAAAPAAPDPGPSSPVPARPPVAYSNMRARQAQGRSSAPGSGNQSSSAGSPTFHQRSTSLRHTRLQLGDIQSKLSKSHNPNGGRTFTEDVIFSYAYKPHLSSQQPIIGEGFCLIPLRLPIDSSKGKGSSAAATFLNLTVTVQSITSTSQNPAGYDSYCEENDFDAINLFDGLAEDPFFNPDSVPVHRLPYQYRRQSTSHPPVAPRVLRRSIPVVPLIALSVRLMSNVPNMVLVALSMKSQLEEKYRVQIESLDASLSNSVMTQLGGVDFPASLTSWDAISLLFSASSLDELRPGLTDPAQGRFAVQSPSSVVSSPSVIVDDPLSFKFLSVSLRAASTVPGTFGQSIASKWHCALDSSALSSTSPQISLSLSHGRRYNVSSRIPFGMSDDLDSILDGIEISFAAPPPIQLKKVFTVHVLVVNRSSKTRKLVIKVPQRPVKRPAQSPRPWRQLPMSQDDFVSSLGYSETNGSSAFCLDGHIELLPLPPKMCQSAHLHFVAIGGNLHNLDPLTILDADSGNSAEISDYLQLYI
ncbi:TRAPP trafficking subunit Trs65-domain-containing protein [Zopfochytrium polystomum]|nr:TRAPP trafficking subunit Trs65-domain-containing protein [Zopfochytrium polystomum]